MGLDDTVKDKMKGDMSLMERIALYIPGYRGYKEKNLRRSQGDRKEILYYSLPPPSVGYYIKFTISPVGIANSFLHTHYVFLKLTL